MLDKRAKPLCEVGRNKFSLISLVRNVLFFSLDHNSFGTISS